MAMVVSASDEARLEMAGTIGQVCKLHRCPFCMHAQPGLKCEMGVEDH